MPKRRSKTSNKAEDTEIETATDYDASATEYRKQIEQLKSLTEAFSKRGKISLDEKLQLLYEVVMNLYNNMELQMDQAFKILLLDARVVQLETLTENLRPEFSAFNKELDELEEIEEETDNKEEIEEETDVKEEIEEKTDNKEEIEEETDVKEEIEEETDKQVEIQILPELQVAPPPTAKAEPIDSKIPPALKKAAANLSGIKSETILAKVPPTSKTA